MTINILATNVNFTGKLTVAVCDFLYLYIRERPFDLYGLDMLFSQRHNPGFSFAYSAKLTITLTCFCIFCFR